LGLAQRFHSSDDERELEPRKRPTERGPEYRARRAFERVSVARGAALHACARGDDLGSLPGFVDAPIANARGDRPVEEQEIGTRVDEPERAVDQLRWFRHGELEAQVVRSKIARTAAGSAASSSPRSRSSALRVSISMSHALACPWIAVQAITTITIRPFTIPR